VIPCLAKCSEHPCVLFRVPVLIATVGSSCSDRDKEHEAPIQDGPYSTVLCSQNSKNSDQTPDVLELTKSVQYSSVISALLASHQIQPVA
jgi:hypothetical protein